ncbi:MAG: DUF89 family protein [Sedimentisphaerales bacterium]|nr:DUF89 family protein [Sedimentisphaerales bacterium]
MRIYLDCLPCFVRQSLDAVRRITVDNSLQIDILRMLFAEMSKIDLNQSPPLMGQAIHRIVRKVTGVTDAYIEIKNRCNQAGKKFLPKLEELIAQSQNPFETSVRLAIAGNIIDFGVNSDMTEADIEKAIERTMKFDFGNNINEFKEAITQANNILYIADNTGENFFDKVLLEQLPMKKITYAVRGKPILNDMLTEDAEIAGIDKLVRVIDNGNDAPGTILEQCSERFKDEFNKADLIIAKGQGNYETLSGVDKDIFFMLKAKCPVIAKHIGCEIGTPVLLRQKQNVLID